MEGGWGVVFLEGSLIVVWVLEFKVEGVVFMGFKQTSLEFRV